MWGSRRGDITCPPAPCCLTTQTREATTQDHVFPRTLTVPCLFHHFGYDLTEYPTVCLEPLSHRPPEWCHLHVTDGDLRLPGASKTCLSGVPATAHPVLALLPVFGTAPLKMTPVPTSTYACLAPAFSPLAGHIKSCPGGQTLRMPLSLRLALIIQPGSTDSCGPCEPL